MKAIITVALAVTTLFATSASAAELRGGGAARRAARQADRVATHAARASRTLLATTRGYRPLARRTADRMASVSGRAARLARLMRTHRLSLSRARAAAAQLRIEATRTTRLLRRLHVTPRVRAQWSAAVRSLTAVRGILAAARPDRRIVGRRLAVGIAY